jgi:hypothetical protein
VARTTIEKFTDDLDGSENDVQTVTLALDGQRVEIDLSSKNRRELERFVGKYFQKGRSLGRAPGRPKKASANGRRRGAPPQPKYDRQAFLAWAKRKGYKVPQRGRTKTAWIEEFLGSSKKPTNAPSRRRKSKPVARARKAR